MWSLLSQVHTCSSRRLWNIQHVNAPAAWALGATGSGAKLLILDSGIDLNNPDLSPVVAHTCVGGSGQDNFGHGTNVTGAAAAVNNTIQGVGVAHGVALWSTKIGDYAPDPWAMLCGIQYGVANQVTAINISAGVPPLSSLTDQINAASQSGILIIAAVGNAGVSPVSYPASLASVIAVGAIDINNVRGSFSNFGNGIDFVAPGVNVPTTCLGGGYPCIVSGTSIAAPHVAAAAALLKAYNPSWSRTEIIRRLRVTATRLGSGGWNQYYGYGLINVGAALTAPPPLVTDISGPRSVRINSCGVWHAVVSGGAPPYTYTWSRNFTPVSQLNPYSECFWQGSAGTQIVLSLEVRDSYGQISTNAIPVNITN